MTQSDKDFITRVQVAQLVTSDPYADDFYAQVFASIREQRVAANGVAAGNVSAQGRTHSRAPHRRENAIQRMQAQVERLVNNMKNRELSKESGSKRCLSISKCLLMRFDSATNTTLQNVLGKTSGRSYKAAPRQLLQVAIASPESQKAHPHPVKDHEIDNITEAPLKHGQVWWFSLFVSITNFVQLPAPFTRAESLLIIERLFSIILDVEQLRRNRPTTEDSSAISEWNTRLQKLLDDIWKGLRIWGPLYET
jgi:DNA topoisomerase 2-associated protein PAT1